MNPHTIQTLLPYFLIFNKGIRLKKSAVFSLLLRLKILKNKVFKNKIVKYK